MGAAVLLFSTAAAQHDSLPVNDPASSHLLWMATGSLSPSDHLSLNAFDIICPTARYTIDGRVQLTVANVAFLPAFLFGVKGSIFSDDHWNAALAMDKIWAKDMRDVTAGFYYSGSVSYHRTRYGFHATYTRMTHEDFGEDSGVIQLGADILLHQRTATSGFKILAETMLGQRKGVVTTTNTLMLGVRNFGAASFIDAGFMFFERSGSSIGVAPMINGGVVLR